MTYLYRGVSLALHERNNGLLMPKESGPFKKPALWDEAIWGSGETFDLSEANAVIRHQRHQKGIPTSGLSTTPHYERAKFYATHGGTLVTGVIYQIERSLLAYYKVKGFVVSQYAAWPAIPEDEEVILVSESAGIIPSEIVLETHFLLK